MPNNKAILKLLKGLIALVLLNSFFHCYSQPQDKANFSDSIAKSLKMLSLKDRIEVLNSLSTTFFEDSSELSLNYAEMAYKNAKALNDPLVVEVQAEKLGDMCTTLGKYQLALEYYEVCLNSYKNRNSPEDIIRTYRLIGNAYYYMGLLDKSLENHLESLRFAEEINSEFDQAAAFNNLGIIYENEQDLAKALENYQKAEVLFAKDKSDNNLGLTLINIGNVLHKKNDDDSSLVCYMRALRIFEKVKNLENIATVSQNIAIIYEIKEDFDKALEYNEKSLALHLKTNNFRGVSDLSNNLGYYFLKRKDFEKSKESFIKSLEYASRTKSISLKQKAYSSLYEFYKETENYKEALENLEESNNLIDSLYSLDTKQKISELLIKTDLKQKEKEYTILQRFFIYISILSAIIVLVLIFSYRIKVLSNQKLKKINLKVEDQNVKLESIIATKNKFVSIIAHDLKNPLAAFMGLTETMHSSYPEMTDSDRIRLLQELNKLASNTFDLLDNMLKWGQAQSGTIDYNPIQFDITSVVTETINVLFGNANIKVINIENNVTIPILVTADRNMIATTIRNILSNAIKFTQPGGRIVLTAYVLNNSVTFLAEDNGTGISEENLAKLFKIDSQVRSLGTSNEPGTGLGLVLCKDFIERNGGTMIVESKKGEGSTFGFTIPIV